MTRFFAFLAFVVAVFGAQGAAAQTYQPGDEIRGHTMQVESNGEVNTISFERDGAAQISSSTGAQASGRWFTEGQTLCLELGSGARECWPYQTAFRTGQPVTLTSSCAAVSRWTPVSTETMAPPVQERRGERG